VTVIVKEPDAPAAKVPKLHDTFPADPIAGAVQTPPGAFNNENVAFEFVLS
jgi:hypothetical protein